MNTFALLTANRLQAPEPEFTSAQEPSARRFLRQGQEPPPAVLRTGNDNSTGPLEALSQTVGIRLACSSVVRWYHGGINE